jgi:hypothetical protein
MSAPRMSTSGRKVVREILRPNLDTLVDRLCCSPSPNKDSISYLNSNLSNPYRCDFVFAVTQGGINATMMDYLSNSPFPEVTCVWVMSEELPPRVLAQEIVM